MNREQFKQFKELVLYNLDDTSEDEYFGTDRVICANLLDVAEEIIFYEQDKEVEERAKLKELIEKYGVPK